MSGRKITEKFRSLTETLLLHHSLSLEDYEYLLANRCEEGAALLAREAVRVRKELYGNTVYIRGLIEISNICRNDCLYCGIRKSNLKCERYRLMPEEIFSCVEEGYTLGFRTVVLQGGEDAFYTDAVLCDLISRIRKKYPECAVTLSLGERGTESFRRLYEAGAERYLLRHETADEKHYEKLHPPEMFFQNRMKSLYELKRIGYQTGCGFMVGLPFQTYKTLAEDLKFIETFRPDMCGIGPFIPHKDTPFGKEQSTVNQICFAEKKQDICADASEKMELTCYLLSIIRLIHPPVLLPATTALSTLHPLGREKGILAGANVVMPNLSPQAVRAKYELYDHKLFSGAESAGEIENLRQRMKRIGYEIVTDRGDRA